MNRHVVLDYLNSLSKLKIESKDEKKIIYDAIDLISSIEIFKDLYDFSVFLNDELFNICYEAEESISYSEFPIEVNGENVGNLFVSSKNSVKGSNPDHEMIFILTSSYIGTLIEKSRKTKSLEDSKLMYKSIVDNSHGGIFIIDQNFQIIYANKRIEKIFEESLCNIIGRDFRDYLAPESRELVATRYLKRQSGEVVENNYDFKIIVGNNKIKQLKINSTIIKDSENRVKTIAQLLDITESKKTEEELENIEKRWEYAVEGSSQGIWDWDIKNNRVFFSKKCKKILGYKDSEVKNFLKEWRTRIYKDDRRRVFKNLFLHLKGKNDSFESTYRILSKSGKHLWVHTRGKIMLKDGLGKPSRLMGTMLDVNDQIENRIKLDKLNKFTSLISEIIHETLKVEFDESVYQRIFDKVFLAIANAQGGAMFLKDGDCFKIVASSHLDKDALKNVCLNKNQLVMKEDDEVKIYRDMSINKDLEKDKRDTLEKSGRANQIKALLSIPLKSDNEIIGYFTLDNYESENAFDDENLYNANILGKEIEVLINRIKLEEELKSQKNILKNLSYSDPLTNLPNRRFLMNKAINYLSLARRLNTSLCIAYIDLKGFKRINDTYGHDTGDYLLKAFGERMTKILRGSDILSRIGGDEFILMLPDTDRVSTRFLIERIENDLKDDFTFSDNSIKINCNIGLAVFPDDGDSFEDLLKKSDIAMYSAKRNNLFYNFYSEKKDF